MRGWRMTNLKEQLVVITGASSGIGRAAAMELARRGCVLVLAARRVAALEVTAEQCRRLGAEVLVVETDVTDEAAVTRLAERALSLRGRIDIWVNNAGVTAFGMLDEVPMEDHRRVIEVNVYGAMHGARAVLPIFRRQRAGVLINVGSILSKVGQPYVPSYVISKFAVRGLTETLRAAYADEPNIHICSLLPYAVDTPHFQEGANHVGLDAHSMAPMQSPETVARALAALAERPRRELHVPRVAALGLVLHDLLPATVERMILHIVREWHFGFQPQPETHGNLFAPTTSQGEVHGRRPARIRFGGLLWWTAGHFLRLAAEQLTGRRAGRRDLTPHLAP
jgi:short-subunit dehydrogenase